MSRRITVTINETVYDYIYTFAGSERQFDFGKIPAPAQIFDKDCFTDFLETDCIDFDIDVTSRVITNDVNAYYAYLVVEHFNRYINSISDNLAQMQIALETEYNPLSNYDMIETNISGHNQGKSEDKNTISGTITNDNQSINSDTVTNSVVPFNSSDFHDASENSRNFHNRSDNTYNNYENNTVKENKENTSVSDLTGDSITAHQTDSNILKRSGNIGVTTSQQMLESELNIRKRNIIYEVLCTWKNKYLFGLW